MTWHDGARPTDMHQYQCRERLVLRRARILRDASPPFLLVRSISACIVALPIQLLNVTVAFVSLFVAFLIGASTKSTDATSWLISRIFRA